MKGVEDSVVQLEVIPMVTGVSSVELSLDLVPTCVGLWDLWVVLRVGLLSRMGPCLEFDFLNCLNPPNPEAPLLPPGQRRVRYQRALEGTAVLSLGPRATGVPCTRIEGGTGQTMGAGGERGREDANVV